MSSLRGNACLDIAGLILDLRRQRNDLAEAIAALERFSLSGSKRRGRPPTYIHVEPKPKERVKQMSESAT
jgi:hypothetical protein